MDIIFDILFLTFNNVNGLFAKQKFTQKLYIPAKILLISKPIQIINQKEFITVVLDPGKEAFIVYIVSFSLSSKIQIHPAWKTQITLLLIKKVTIAAKYLDFIDLFLKKLIVELSKYFAITKHLINLELGKQLSYSPIYNLGLIELETFKIYFKTNLAMTSFTHPNFLLEHTSYLYRSLMITFIYI